MSRKHRFADRQEPLPTHVSVTVEAPPPQERPSLGELRTQGEPENPVGLVCRKCGCSNFKVDYTRSRADMIMRKRICRACGQHLVTHERPAGR